MKTHNITNSIPGGQYGNDPGFFGPDPKQGNVVILAIHLVDAIVWLRRRATILETNIHGDDEICLVYRLR